MMVKCIESGKFYFDNGESISMEEYANGILNLHSLNHITPGTLSTFTIFNLDTESTDMTSTLEFTPASTMSPSNASSILQRVGFNWTLQKDFESWLDGLVH